jgi:hypothetical protein
VGKYQDHLKQEQLFVGHALDLPTERPATARTVVKEAAKNATPVSD